jgi:arginyl-tRNA synthetase
VVLELQKQLGEAIRAVLQEKYDLQLDSIPIETPPDLRFGEMATPIAFELARKLRKAPKIIAQEIVTALGPLRGFDSLDVAGAGYINARLDRAAAVRATASIPSHLSDKNKDVAKVGHPFSWLVKRVAGEIG